MYPRNCAIQPGSDAGINLNFFDQVFAVDSYLWLEGRNAYIGFIESLHQDKGNLSRLFESLTKRGFHVFVPTPFPHMREILKHKGFVRREEYNAHFDENIEVWVLTSDLEETREPASEPSGFRSEPILGWLRGKFGHISRGLSATVLQHAREGASRLKSGRNSVTPTENGEKRPQTRNARS